MVQGDNSDIMDFNKVSQYVEWLIQLEETDSEFSFANKRDLILKNIKNDWGYWVESQKTKQMKLYENVFSNLEEYQ